jgi:hypothetical protein
LSSEATATTTIKPVFEGSSLSQAAAAKVVSLLVTFFSSFLERWLVTVTPCCVS